MTTSELIAKINEAKLSSAHWAEDEFPELGGEIDAVNEDEHRWYTIKTLVFKFGDDFIGVRGATGLKSESMGYDDCCVECEAFEMKEVQSVTYKKA